MATTDVQGVIEYVNDKFCEISQYRRDELIGKTHRVINSAFHTRDFWKEMWRTIGRGDIWRGEIMNRAKDGSYYWVATTIVPFLNDQGKPRQYIAIRHEITERKLAEDHAHQLNAQLERRNRELMALHEIGRCWPLRWTSKKSGASSTAKSRSACSTSRTSSSPSSIPPHS